MCCSGRKMFKSVLVNLQPTLKGQRITLAPLEPKDLDGSFEAASDPLVWEQHPNSDRYKRPVFEEFFRKAIESKGAFKVIDNQTGKIIGGTRFYEMDEKNNTIMIGYTFLNRSYWGGMINQEMKKLMLDYAFQSVNTVYFQIGETNLRSQKALEKIGGVLVDKMMLDGFPYRRYEITSEKWKSNPMQSKSDEYKKQIDEARILLLELHKILIDTGRVDYEKKHGEIKNPHEWVRLLIGDAFFSWLHPLSKLITTIDELMEVELPVRELDAKAVRAEIENMIGDFSTTPKDFRDHFLDIIQREPAIVMKLSKLKQSLQSLPKPEPEKMGDLLNVRQQWTAALKLKYFKSTNKQ